MALPSLYPPSAPIAPPGMFYQTIQSPHPLPDPRLEGLQRSLLGAFHYPEAWADLGQIAILPVPGGLAIRLSKTALLLEGSLQNAFGLQGADILFHGFVREVRIPLDRVDAVLAHCKLPASLQGEIIRRSNVLKDYKIHTSMKGNLLRPTHTLSLSLARLDPAQLEFLKLCENNTRAEPEKLYQLKLPLIEATDMGLEIWFPKNSSPAFIMQVKNIFMLIPKEGSLLKPFGEYDTVMRVDRDDIQLFLRRMGLDDLQNVGGRTSDNQNVAHFLWQLQQLEKYHNYIPAERPNNPLETIANSLRVLLRHEKGKEFTPLVVLHPMRGLIIRLPKAPFSKRLIEFLCFGSKRAPCTLRGIRYEHEIVIPFERIGIFLKSPMHLEKLQGDIENIFKKWNELINSIWSKKGYTSHEKGVFEIRVANCASLRLYALLGLKEAEEVKQYGDFGEPEKMLPLPRFVFSPRKMTLYFPLLTILQESSLSNLFGWLAAEEESTRSVALRNEISSLLGLDLVPCEETVQGQRYNYKVEFNYAPDRASNQILHFLERDLGLRELPSQYAVPYNPDVLGSGRVTCWNELLFGFFNPLRLEFAPHGSVSKEGLKLVPPKSDLPSNLRECTKIEMQAIAHGIFVQTATAPEKADSYLVTIGQLYDRFFKQNPSSLEAAVKEVLNAFFHSITHVHARYDLERKRNSLINVIGAVDLPLPSSYVRVMAEMKRVSAEEDNIKDLLLAIVQEWKNDALIRTVGGSFAAAQVAWGEEFGLNIELGSVLASEHSQLTEEKKALFRKKCFDAKDFIIEITQRINKRVDNYGSVMDVSLYEAFTQIWLEEMGFDAASLEGKISSFFLTDPATYQVKVSEEGAKFLLTQVGLLNP